MLIVFCVFHRIPAEVDLAAFGVLAFLLQDVLCLGLLLVPGHRGLDLVLEIVALRVSIVLYASNFDLELADVVLDAFVLDGGGVQGICPVASPLFREYFKLTILDAHLVA